MKLGRSIVISNVAYTLDYTKTTYNAPGTVFSIPIPAGKIRLNVLAMSFDTTAVSNFVVQLIIDNTPFLYPTGTTPYNAPPSVYTLCGNVPTDYIDIEGGNNITLLSVMTGSAAVNGNLNLTLNAKQIIEDD